MNLKSMLTGDWFEKLATATVATPAIERGERAGSVAKVADVAVARSGSKGSSANDERAYEDSGWALPRATLTSPEAVPVPGEAGRTEENVKPDIIDRWCWPRSPAMNSAELATFTRRARCFSMRNLKDVESLADQLVGRDRSDDDRRLCAECAYLFRSDRCSQGLAVLDVLQRCDRFIPEQIL